MPAWLWDRYPRRATPAIQPMGRERTANQRCAGWRAVSEPIWKRSEKERNGYCRAGLYLAEEDTGGSNFQAGGRARPGEAGGGISGNGVRANIGEV